MEKNNLIQVLQDWELLLSEISRNGTALDNDALDLLNDTIRAALTQPKADVDLEAIENDIKEKYAPEGIPSRNAVICGIEQTMNYLAAQGYIGVPEGHALVPIEPTIEMIAAAYQREQIKFDRSKYGAMYNDIYKAMLKAAPKKEV